MPRVGNLKDKTKTNKQIKNTNNKILKKVFINYGAQLSSHRCRRPYFAQLRYCTEHKHKGVWKGLTSCPALPQRRKRAFKAAVKPIPGVTAHPAAQ